jgi:hypothetical protein
MAYEPTDICARGDFIAAARVKAWRDDLAAELEQLADKHEAEAERLRPRDGLAMEHYAVASAYRHAERLVRGES